MAGLAIVIPRAGSGPAVLPALHSAGVSGWDHRFVASQISANEGETINTWNDLGTAPSNMALANGSATVMKDSGNKFVRLAGSATAIGEFVSGNVSTPRTIAAVIRKSALSDKIIETAGYQVARAGNGAWQLSGISAGGITVGAPSSDWVFFLGTLETAAAVARLGSTEATASTSFTPSGQRIAFRSGMNNNSDIAEYITWPSYLNLTDRNAVYAAMQAKYSLGL